MRFCQYLSLVVVTLIITGCAIQPQQENPAAVVWDNNNSQWVTPEAMTKKLTDAKYVVVGELHQSLTMRDDLLNALDSLKHEGWLKVLVIDALKPEAAAEGKSYIEQLNSGPPALGDRYRPFVVWADLQDGVTLLGAATPRTKLSSLNSQEGQNWLSEQTRGVLPEQKKKYLKEVLAKAHTNSEQDERTRQYLLNAQQLNDYFMAKVTTSTRQNTILLTRAFHARKDLGVEPYIKKLEPGAKVISVLMLGPLHNQKVPSHLVDELKKYYDYIWLEKPVHNLMLAPKNDYSAPLEQ